MPTDISEVTCIALLLPGPNRILEATILLVAMMSIASMIMMMAVFSDESIRLVPVSR